jgi:predicted metal-dependent hydrolase
MADYVVVHELCHLAHFDHSEAFWAQVARAIPDYRDIRRQMKLL